MSIIDIDKWQEIFQTLKSNKLRTFLTAFGVFWGIFMLVVMLGSGTGLQNGVTDGFGDFATNSAFVWTETTSMPYKGYKRGRFIHLNNGDMEAIKQHIPEIDLLAPRLQAWGADANNVSRGDKTGAFTIHGDYPEFNLIDPQNIVQGRFLNLFDIQERRKVAVIGSEVRKILFEEDENPVGEYVKIKGLYWQVIGVFEPGSQAMSFGGDKAKTIFLPFSSLQKAYNFGDDVHYFSITAKNGVPASLAEEKVITYLKKIKSVHPDDDRAIGHFNVEKEYQQMSGLFLGINVLIWVVGIGTLLAGVIGVSNIMLIIVKERTKEIGIQRAIGATPFRIINQIITESVFLTSFAGFFGLAIGVFLVAGVNKAISGMGDSVGMFKNPEVDFNIALTALVVLIIAGLFAGLIPAKRAIDIKPIEALRNE